MAGLIWFVWRCREESKNSYECREELAREEAKEREEKGGRRVRVLRDALPLLVGIAEADRARLIGVGDNDWPLRRWRRDACMAHARDRKSTRLNSSHSGESRMPSSA